MATAATKQSVNSEKRFFERLVYDVLVYTLTKCGLPRDRLPTTKCSKNVYHRANFVKIAGVSVLRTSLIMRDKWRRMFVSRRNSFGFCDDDVRSFLIPIATFNVPCRTNVAQSLFELLLASCNEIMMFFHCESIDINFDVWMQWMSYFVSNIKELDKNPPNNVEGLFDSFNNLSGYTEWISDFISTYAIPYGSREDVSDLFLRHVKNKFDDDFKKIMESIIFLPTDLFLAIANEECKDLGVRFSSDGESQELPKSRICVVEEKELPGSLSTEAGNVSKDSCQNQQSSKNSLELELEKALEKMCLDTKETFHAIHDAVAKRGR